MRRPGSSLAADATQSHVPATWLAALATLHHALVGSLFGLGDAEALYVVYARHLQAGYLDHPPLVALVLRLSTALLGTSPFACRLPAALLFGATLLLADRLARALGGGERAARWAVLAVLCVPMFSIGSVAATPDAVAAPLTLLVLLAASRAAERPASLGASLLVGLALGACFLAKYTALLLAPGLLVLGARRGVRAGHLALAALAALAVASPVVLWNVARGWPSPWHRLVWSQPDAGLSLRNAGALVGGQLGYVGPPMLALAAWALWSLRGPPHAAWRLPAASALAGAVAIALVSRVAEPHWTAIAFLPLCIAVGLLVEHDARASRLARVAIVWGGACLALIHLVVLTPALPLLVPPSAYVPRFDLANELHGWPAVARALRAAQRPDEDVAAGHYTMCAQLEVALDRDVRCVTAETDDWDLWGRGALRRDRATLWVSDERFADAPAGARAVRDVRIRRGSRVVRTFRLWRIPQQAGR